MSAHEFRSMRSRFRSERGITFIQVGIAIFVLIGFLSFVLDYGVMWLGRVQAQNAADSGAIAGAIARAFDEPANPPAVNGITEQSATLAAEANAVFNATPGVDVSWVCPPFSAGSRCVRVDAYRDGTNAGSTPLPTFFAQMFGFGSQRVRATATAEVLECNATNCMRPFAVADKWIEYTPVPNTPRASGPTDNYERWDRQGQNVVQLNPHDLYNPPSPSGPGSGYSLPADYGAQVVLKGGNNPSSVNGPIGSGWFLPVRLPDGAGGYTSGAQDYRDAIGNCIGQSVSIGDYLPTENGAMIGPTSQGFDDLRQMDPNASWNTSTNSVQGSCAPTCAPISPRIVPISVFDLNEYQYRSVAGDWNGSAQYPTPCPAGGNECVHIVNILGFFVDRMSGNDVIGYLMTIPGNLVSGNPSVGGGAAFLVDIQLIQ